MEIGISNFRMFHDEDSMMRAVATVKRSSVASDLLLQLAEREIEAAETEIEVMEPIALCGEVREDDETLERCRIDKAMKVENKVFFFHGRFICGPDARGLMLTTASIILPSRIFAVYVGKDDDPQHSVPVVTFLSTRFSLGQLTQEFFLEMNKKVSEEGGTRDGTKSKRINHRFYMALDVRIIFLCLSSVAGYRIMYGNGLLGMVKTCPERLALAAFGAIASGFGNTF
ncbi:hypothetical protein RJT34_28791 [Clitoria ternatea]|uniref:Uncharacterized protein n=1 Tax=Clitoria ternatea TaxID=43366 RepID=A0AAN9I995_CLITE